MSWAAGSFLMVHSVAEYMLAPYWSLSLLRVVTGTYAEFTAALPNAASAELRPARDVRMPPVHADQTVCTVGVSADAEFCATS